MSVENMCECEREQYFPLVYVFINVFYCCSFVNNISIPDY